MSSLKFKLVQFQISNIKFIFTFIGSDGSIIIDRIIPTRAVLSKLFRNILPLTNRKPSFTKKFRIKTLTTKRSFLRKTSTSIQS